MEDILLQSNEVLIDIGVMPNLDMKARDRELAKQKRAVERPTTDAETRAFSDIEETKPVPEDLSDKKPSPAEPSSKTEITRKIVEKVEQEKPQQSNAEMFAMMQTLVKGYAEQRRGESELPVKLPVSAPDAAETTANLQAKNGSLKQQQVQLMSVLSDIQSRLNLGDTSSTPPSSNGSIGNNINESISRTLEESSNSGDISAIDLQSSDVLNLVTLL